MKTIARKGLPVFLAILLLWSPVSTANQLRIGVASRNITPKEQIPLWGYGWRHNSVSQGTLDALLATALVIEVGTNKIAIVALDLGRSPSETSLSNIRRRISKADINYSFIAASHTHNGPVLELSDQPGKGKGRFDAALRYYAQMENSIVEAVLQADATLVPARIGAGSVKLNGFNYNRESSGGNAPNDRDLAVLCFDDLTGKRIAILVNFAAHPTMVPLTNFEYSADYVGVLRRGVEKETGATVLFMQGAAGDQSAYGRFPEGYEGFGNALAHEVVELSSKVATTNISNPYLAVKESRFRFDSRVNWKDPKVRKQYGKAFFPELVSNYCDEYAYGICPRLTVAVLNDVVLVGVSGEFFSGHSIYLKAHVKAKQLFFLGYCNGYNLYFPTREAIILGGYGTDDFTSPVAVGAGEELMKTALQWVIELQGKNK